jgi:hypothetical protein
MRTQLPPKDDVKEFTVVKWLVVLAVLAGLIAGFVAAGRGDDPDSFAAIRRRSEWQSERTSAILAGRPEPEPNWDNRPWAAKNAVLFGGIVTSGVFVVGLLVVMAVNVQPKRKTNTSTSDPNADPDADLFEDFEDPYAEGLVDDAPDAAAPDPSPDPSIRVNPRRKARSSA